MRCERGRGVSILVGVAIAGIGLFGAGSARGDETASARRAAAAREMDRPYTMAELSGGLLSLPFADVCLTQDKASCAQGESSVAVGLANLYRTGPIGFGAGIVYARTLRGDAAAGDPSLERSHSRGYFLVEAQFRYYALRTKSWEWFLGPILGGVIVNDSWSVKADRQPYSDAAYIGPRAATIGTEGLAFGASVGGEYSLANNWSFGAHLRYSSWFLPQNPERSPTGDTASLSGRVDMIDFGLVIAYRIAL